MVKTESVKQESPVMLNLGGHFDEQDIGRALKCLLTHVKEEKKNSKDTMEKSDNTLTGDWSERHQRGTPCTSRSWDKHNTPMMDSS